MKQNRRAAAAALALFLALSLLLSALFLLFEADHDCAGACCSVCSALALCRETLAGVALAATALLFPPAAALCARRAPSAVRRTAPGASPVLRKVKLLN